MDESRERAQRDLTTQHTECTKRFTRRTRKTRRGGESGGVEMIPDMFFWWDSLRSAHPTNYGISDGALRAPYSYDKRRKVRLQRA